MKTVGFDLTFISSERIVGSAKFIQRLIREMMKRELHFKCIFYIQSNIPLDLFGIPANKTGIEIVRVPHMVGKYRRILFQQTLFYIYLKKCDVLYGFCTYLPVFARAKKIITLHDMLPFVFTKKHSLFRRLFIIDFTKFIAKKAAHIVTVSEYSKKDILNILRKKEQDISIIYNFICPEEKVIKGNTTGDDGNIQTADGIIHLKKPYICTVSSLQPGKNLASLIKAFNLFHKKNPQYSLYISGGKGWGYQELFELVEQSEANDYIHFTGYVEDEELDKIYSGCVGVAYVSYFEGFGIPPLEGFHHAKPCVASNVTSLPEVVGNAGILIDPYNIYSIVDGLEKLISKRNDFDDDICLQLSKFSADKETSKFIKLLENL